MSSCDQGNTSPGKKYIKIKSSHVYVDKFSFPGLWTFFYTTHISLKEKSGIVCIQQDGDLKHWVVGSIQSSMDASNVITV